MLVLDGYKVKISRGDSYTIALKIKGYIPEGTQAIAAIAKKAGGVPIWQSVVPVLNNTAVLRLTESETNVSPGNYEWDIRLLFSDGSLKTIFKPTMFQVLEVVGHA